MKKILILDSNSVLSRAYYAIPPVANSKGKYTNGIHGFLMMLFKLQQEINADSIVATFDRKAKTFRHLAYDKYKYGRKAMPNELIEQISPLKDILSRLNIDVFELDGFEADDLIGTLSKIFEEKGFEVYILTGDRDALQLCSQSTKVIITKKGITNKEVYDYNTMLEVYGVTPMEFIDVKALMGDKSDNIPGVSGIGEKKALKFIKEFHSIENLFLNLDSLKEGKDKEKLILEMDKAVLSKKLATICREVPIEFSMDELKSYKDHKKDKVNEFLKEYELKFLMTKVYDNEEQDKVLEKIILNTIDNRVKLEEKIKELHNSEHILFINCEVYGSKISELHMGNIYFRINTENYFIPEENVKENFDLIIKLFSSDIKKVCFDSKKIYKVIIKNNGEVKNIIFDIILGEYLLNPGKEYDEITLVGLYSGVFLEKENKHLSINYLEEIYNSLRNKIEDKGMKELYYEIEHPLCFVLAMIELEGFRVSMDILNSLKNKYEIEINESINKIYELAGEEFNINSTKQLGKILFEKLDLPIIKKTKTGYSTNIEVLEVLIDHHDIIKEIIDYRHLSKIQSTYILGLIGVVDVDGKIHTSFNQTITTTGRLSSTEPNLQNIPIKDPLGREIRKVFVPDNEECVILSADYSQIELRVLAHISKDENMIEAFKKEYDIHKITASEIFSVDESEVTYDMRSKCKAVNFGIVYGIGDYALSQDLKISRSEAREYMDKYFEKYKGVKKYLDEIVEYSEKNGYVKTEFNRIRNIPEIKSSNKIVKSLGDRLAMNTPIQGTAADIIKLAMVKLFNRLEKDGFKSKIILQVHDELVLNVYKSELDKVLILVKEEMENCYNNMLVPLKVNIAYGETWFEAK